SRARLSCHRAHTWQTQPPPRPFGAGTDGAERWPRGATPLRKPPGDPRATCSAWHGPGGRVRGEELSLARAKEALPCSESAVLSPGPNRRGTDWFRMSARTRLCPRRKYRLQPLLAGTELLPATYIRAYRLPIRPPLEGPRPAERVRSRALLCTRPGEASGS